MFMAYRRYVSNKELATGKREEMELRQTLLFWANNAI